MLSNGYVGSRLRFVCATEISILIGAEMITDASRMPRHHPGVIV